MNFLKSAALGIALTLSLGMSPTYAATHDSEEPFATTPSSHLVTQDEFHDLVTQMDRWKHSKKKAQEAAAFIEKKMPDMYDLPRLTKVLQEPIGEKKNKDGTYPSAAAYLHEIFDLLGLSLEPPALLPSKKFSKRTDFWKVLPDLPNARGNNPALQTFEDFTATLERYARAREALQAWRLTPDVVAGVEASTANPDFQARMIEYTQTREAGKQSLKKSIRPDQLEALKQALQHIPLHSKKDKVAIVTPIALTLDLTEKKIYQLLKIYEKKCNTSLEKALKIIGIEIEGEEE